MNYSTPQRRSASSVSQAELRSASLGLRSPTAKRKSADLNGGSHKKIRVERPPENAYGDDEEQYRVGCHIEEPNLPIYCQLDDNETPYTWAPREMVIDEEILERWSALVSQNNHVPLEKIELDEKILQSNFTPVNSLDAKRKEAILKEFILAKNSDKGIKKAMAGESKNTLLEELHVGRMKTDKVLPVYAYLRQHSSLRPFKTVMFRTRRSDWDSSEVEYHKTLVRYEQIDFKEEIKKSTMEDTKEHITVLMNAQELGKVKDEPQIPGPVIVLGDRYEQSPKSKKNDELDIGSEVLGSLDEIVDVVRGAIEGCKIIVKSQEDEIKQQRATIASQRVSIQRLEKKIRALKSETRKERGSDDGTTLTALQSEAKSSNERSRKSESEKDVLNMGSSPQSQQFKIGQRVFRLIPKSQPNAGMYRERLAREIMEDGKLYEERLIMKQFEIQVSGTRTGKEVEAGGVKCMQLLENGSEKLVQKHPSPKVVTVDGKSYMSWFIRREKPMEGEDSYYV